MILDNYWSDIDSRLEKLIKFGEVKLPTLKQFGLDFFANDISNEMGSLTFKELTDNHNKFLNKIEINTYLIPKLFKIAQEVFDYKGELSNQYHIARKVEPGNKKEMYRAHFDSHIFTIIFPLKIPTFIDEGHCGELIYFPNIRPNPKNELKNIIDKIYFKKYASKNGLEKLSENNQKKIENFKDNQPLIICGKQTLHTNYPVSANCSSFRLTLLAHLFDNSPKYSAGNIFRHFRNR